MDYPEKPFDILEGHKHSIFNREEILGSTTCGCFSYLAIFAPHDISEWIPESRIGKDRTALCPVCGIDSVIGSQSGYPINWDFLSKMHEHWFTKHGKSMVERWVKPIVK